MRLPVTLLALALAAAPVVARPAGPGAAHERYAPALAEARARDVPLLVDVWAPW